MHILIDLFIIFAVWWWGNWRNWKEYHSSMLFLAVINLFYYFLTSDYILWTMKPDIIFGYKVTEILYTFVALTGTSLIFLSRLPNSLKKQIIYMIKWMFIYAAVEYVLYKTGRIVYDHGWSFICSVVFDIILFPSLYFQYKKPILAYIEFIIITILGIVYFKVPL